MTGEAASTLTQLLARQAAARPAAPALVGDQEALDYAALQAQAGRLAASLAGGHGIVRGDRVAWLGANEPAQVALLFALARLGAVLLPLNHRLAPAEWQAQWAECTPRLLVHDTAFAPAAQALAQAVAAPAVGARALAAQVAGPGGADEPTGGADDPVLLVYTSGTTSRPRAAVHTQAMLLANLRAAAQVQGLAPTDTVLTALPLFHVGGLCIQTLPALGVGARVLLHPRFDAGAVLAAIARERPSLTLQVPATLAALVAHPDWAGTDLRSLRAIWAGSSLLPEALVRAVLARGVPLCNVYGATETGPFSIALPPEQAAARMGACGWPAPGVQVRLHAPNAAGEGELWLRGPALVRHYWPALPACDAEGWFHTGDLATVAADGCHTITGRAKELIISGGENIHPAQIEEALLAHPAVRECAAFGLPDARWGEVVAVALVLHPGRDPGDEALREHLAGRIARFKLPRLWLRVQALPRTALGKLQRGALAALATGSLPKE